MNIKAETTFTFINGSLSSVRFETYNGRGQLTGMYDLRGEQVKRAAIDFLKVIEANNPCDNAIKELTDIEDRI